MLMYALFGTWYQIVHYDICLFLLLSQITRFSHRNQTDVGLQSTDYTGATDAATSDSPERVPLSLQRFKYLATKLSQQEAALSIPCSRATDSAQSLISQYLAEVQDPSFSAPSDALSFWKERRSVYKDLALIAEDLLSAPASQAYVERIFSLCGLLTTGRRNRMLKSLEMRVCLKLNKNILQESGFCQVPDFIICHMPCTSKT